MFLNPRLDHIYPKELELPTSPGSHLANGRPKPSAASHARRPETSWHDQKSSGSSSSALAPGVLKYLIPRPTRPQTDRLSSGLVTRRRTQPHSGASESSEDQNLRGSSPEHPKTAGYETMLPELINSCNGLSHCSGPVHRNGPCLPKSEYESHIELVVGAPGFRTSGRGKDVPSSLTRDGCSPLHSDAKEYNSHRLSGYEYDAKRRCGASSSGSSNSDEMTMGMKLGVAKLHANSRSMKIKRHQILHGLWALVATLYRISIQYLGPQIMPPTLPVDDGSLVGPAICRTGALRRSPDAAED
ncbi:hypothetical protein HD554DRAFT_2037261 [Boletus coccyginus]|nr:hypothetical protein HD554DRAFT_2037261 [Boletus coccyginus]